MDNGEQITDVAFCKKASYGMCAIKASRRGRDLELEDVSSTNYMKRSVEVSSSRHCRGENPELQRNARESGMR